MDGFDSKTVILIMAIGQVLSIFIFSYYLFFYNNASSKIKIYVIGRFLQLFGPLLSLFYANSLTPTIMTLSILLFYPGIAIESFCLVNHKNNPDKRPLVYLLIFSGLATLIYAFIASNIIIRVVFTSGFYASIFFYIFLKSVFDKKNTSIQKLIGWISFFVVLVNLVRIFFAALEQKQLPIYSEALPQILFLLSFVIITFTFPLLFLLIIQEKIMKETLKLNATKNKFFKIIGHDLKAPIWQMIQFSELIEDRYDELSKDQLLFLVKDLKESSTNGFNLLENLLNWAIANTNKLEFKPEKVSLEELIYENANLTSKQRQNKNIKLHVVDDYKNKALIDKNMINTVIRNLLSNAIKYTPRGGSIKIHLKHHLKGLLFEIIDNGIGISKERCKMLFQINNTYSTKGTNSEKGTGIGLILCSEFIKRHMGNISVESEIGKGSTFSFWLPVGE